MEQAKKKIFFIGAEVMPFAATGGLGDVMGSLPASLAAEGCDVRVVLPLYEMVSDDWRKKMKQVAVYDVNLAWRKLYCGAFELVHKGVIYYFLDNEYYYKREGLYAYYDDAERFAFYSKAIVDILPRLGWTPDVIHCNDWQTALVPIYLREKHGAPWDGVKTMFTIHNVEYQGRFPADTMGYVFGLPDSLYEDGLLRFDGEVNLMKGALYKADCVTTVSPNYAQELRSPAGAFGLHNIIEEISYKLRGIINGIDYDLWDPSRDSLLAAPYDSTDVLEKKRANKLALQEELGLEQDENKLVIGLISRLTNQKGLDLVNAILPQLIDGNTQVVVLGTGDPYYEDSFRYYENAYKGSVCSSIMYNEGRAHHIYAGADALLVPSQFEPCGLTQLIAMHYGTIPIVRETGGLKDTVQPYNEFTDEGNGFTFDRYDAGLLLDAINYAKTVYFTDRPRWDEMVLRDMAKDVSWENSARQYRDLYLELTAW